MHFWDFFGEVIFLAGAVCCSGLLSVTESVFFPVIGVGGTLFSVLVYKEKLTLFRTAGLLVGLVAIVFLNL